ncbi:MAG TPA: adenylosuccinate lyase [Candidatus Binataceae bacterium]|nr:adenylosuccinate lyase [Candidatus Binataceae bacterium]
MGNKQHDARAERDEALLAVTPIDGRYRARTRRLADYFSEYALIRYRVRVEIEWYISLAENPGITALPAMDAGATARLRSLFTDFSPADARQVKQLEAETNHDVKAVEYFLKQKVGALELGLPLEMIHFACTSEDINNLAYALMLKEFNERELLPMLESTVAELAAMARRYKDVAMMARTHGQEASPTTVGKELAIFAYRLERQTVLLRRQEYLGKANGAVGNCNAHVFAYPGVDWIGHSQRFVEGLGLVWNPLTTQIESHDYVAEICDTVTRICTILIGFSRDIWGYVSLGYFTQATVAGEVGSSVMPHKVNPIDFENCEGNLGIASATLTHLSGKLPISRWQRDLSDSTAIRSLGTALGHVVVGLSSLERGLSKLQLNEASLASEFEDEKAWEVVAEAIQTVMRRCGLDRPYERLKELTRGRDVNRAVIEEFVASLPLDAETRAAFAKLSPKSYVGLAAELVERFAPQPRGSRNGPK